MLAPAHRRYLIVDQIAGSILINFPLNAGIAWALFRGRAVVPLWGLSSIAADTIVTAFVLTLLTALLATRHARGQVRAGKLPAISIADIRSSSWLSRSALSRGVILSLAAIALAAIPVVAAFAIAGPHELSFAHFIWFKATFAAALGALIAPLIAWWAICDVAVPKSIGTTL